MAKRKSKAEGIVDEYLGAVAQKDEEKAAKWVTETEKKHEKLEAEADAKAKEIMEESRRKKMDYLLRLATQFNERVKLIDLPPGYSYKINLVGNDKLNLIITDKYKRSFGKGIKVSGEVEYDVNAIHVLATQAENTIDRIEGKMAYQKETGPGFYMPDGSWRKADGQKN